MKWIGIIISIGVLLWGISRLIQAVSNFIRELKNMPTVYHIQEKLRGKTLELYQIQRELFSAKEKCAELENRWQQVKKRKEELRHENRALKKLKP